MSQKIFFLIIDPLYQPHFATELELIEKHLNKGDEVVALVCDSQLSYCDINPKREINECLACTSSRDNLLALYKSRIKILNFTTPPGIDPREILTLRRDFKDLKDLRTYRIDNFDLGEAVLSSLSGKVREPWPNVRKNKNIIFQMLTSALYTYRKVQSILKSENPNLTYIFNGRLSNHRAAVRACESLKKSYSVHERGHSKEYYDLYYDSLPHALRIVRDRITDYWNKSQLSEQEKIEMGKPWFEKRAAGIPTDWISFVASQTGISEDFIDRSKISVALFNSAEFEFNLVSDDWAHPYYPSQLEGIRSLLTALEPHSDTVHIYLRIHPNLVGANEEIKNLSALESPMVTVILPDSKIGSYALLKAADKILTFGSTMGIEATYWGKPSILSGHAPFEGLNVTHHARSEEELVSLILQKDLKSKDPYEAYKYGYYQSVYGIPFKHYKADHHFTGTFKNIPFTPTPMIQEFIDLYRARIPIFIRNAIDWYFRRRARIKLLNN